MIQTSTHEGYYKTMIQTSTHEDTTNPWFKQVPMKVTHEGYYTTMIQTSTHEGYYTKQITQWILDKSTTP